MLTAAFRISTSRKARIQKKRQTKLKRLLYAGWNRKHACVHEWHTQKMVSNASISVAGKLATTGSTSAKSVKNSKIPIHALRALLVTHARSSECRFCISKKARRQRS